MCSFRLYGIIRSHPHEKYRDQDGGAARLDRGMTLWDLTYPQREYHAQLHTTFSISGYRDCDLPRFNQGCAFVFDLGAMCIRDARKISFSNSSAPRRRVTAVEGGSIQRIVG